MKANLVSFTSTNGSFNSKLNLQSCVKIAMFHHGKNLRQEMEVKKDGRLQNFVYEED